MRSLTEWLRDRDDSELSELLRARPDLVTPVPADLDALAQRASTQPSVARALDRLDRCTLRVLEAACVFDEPVAPDTLTAAFSEDEHAAVSAALHRLRALALLCEDADGALHLLPTVRAILPSPAGLGPPAATAFRAAAPARLRALLADLGLPAHPEPEAASDTLAAYLADPDALGGLLAAAGEDARAVLDRLAWGPPTGTISDASRQVRLADASSPIDRLLARGLLAPVDATTVLLPREVALHLRGGRVFRDPEPIPELATAEHGAEACDRTAGGQAFAAIRAVDELLERWGTSPPAVLRAGGLGMRELKNAAREIDATETTAACLIETAYAAELLATDSGMDGEWLPTQAYDVWRSRSPQQRWVALASAWLRTSRVPALVGQRDDRDRPINALGNSLSRAGAREARSEALGVLAGQPPGTAATAESVRARMEWLRPRRWGGSRERLLNGVLAEAEVLGVTGLGALSGPGRRLLEGDPQGAAEALAPLLPEPVDTVLVQPDLTAVAPGPLTQELSREMALAADVESTGGATVYRFTQASVRRALDAGRSAGELLDTLERHSRTPIPQPLRYLVEDVARAHGRIRIGTAEAYLRCDDPGTLNELLADRRAARLQLRRLADTVLASRTGQQELLERLRELGYAPVAESASGDLLLTRASSRRSGVPASGPDRQPHRADEGTGPDERMAVAAVRALRAGDRAATAPRRRLDPERPRSPDQGGRGQNGAPRGRAGANGTPSGSPPRTPAASLAEALRSAAARGQAVWIGYLDAQGRSSSRIVEPARVEGGFLTAYDSTRDALHRFALHRVTGIAALDDETS